MINLLPYDQKKQLRAAHLNVSLIKYLSVVLVGAVFLTAASVMTFVFLQNNNIVKNGDHPLDFSSRQVAEQGEILHVNLVNAGKLLNQQIRYSKILTELAKTLPEGSVLNELTGAYSSSQYDVTLQIFTELNVTEQQLTTALNKSALFSGFKITSNVKDNSEVAKYPNIFNVDMTIRNGATL